MKLLDTGGGSSAAIEMTYHWVVQCDIVMGAECSQSIGTPCERLGEPVASHTDVLLCDLH